jgi:hypothetical protein
MYRSAYKLSQAGLRNAPSKPLEIRFSNDFDLVIIPVVIKGKTYRFAYDTGAQTTLISKELAESEGVKKMHPVKVHDSQGSRQKLPVAQVKEMNLGELCYTNVGVLVSDLRSSPAFSCMDIDGILGMNVICRNNWYIDYKRELLMVSDVKKDPVLPLNAKAIPFKTKSRIPYIDLYMGNIKETFMVDIGKNSDMPSVSQKVTMGQARWQTVGNTAVGLFGGKPDTIAGFLHTVSDSAGIRVNNVHIQQGKNTHSLIGTGFFKKNYESIAFDFEKNILYIPGRETAGSPYLSYGFYPMLTTGILLIGAKELEFSPLTEQLSVGDTIIGVNAISSENASPCAMLKEVWAAKREGKPLTLQFLKSGKVHSVTLPYTVFPEKK